MAAPCGNRSSRRRPTNNRSASRSARRGLPDAAPSPRCRIARARPPAPPRASPRDADRDRCRNRMRKRIDVGNRTAQCRLIACHRACSRFRRGHAAIRIAACRILQTSPGIVTTCLLLFKCRATLPIRGSFTCRHHAASHPDDPALLPDRRPDRDHHAQPAGRLQLDRSFDRQESWSSSAPRSRRRTKSGCW